MGLEKLQLLSPKEPYDITTPNLPASLQLLLKAKAELDKNLARFEEKANEIFAEIKGMIVRNRLSDFVWDGSRVDDERDVWAETQPEQIKLPSSSKKRRNSTSSAAGGTALDQTPSVTMFTAVLAEERPRDNDLEDRIVRTMGDVDFLVQKLCDVRDELRGVPPHLRFEEWETELVPALEAVLGVLTFASEELLGRLDSPRGERAREWEVEVSVAFRGETAKLAETLTTVSVSLAKRSSYLNLARLKSLLTVGGLELEI